MSEETVITNTEYKEDGSVTEVTTVSDAEPESTTAEIVAEIAEVLREDKLIERIDILESRLNDSHTVILELRESLRELTEIMTEIPEVIADVVPDVLPEVIPNTETAPNITIIEDKKDEVEGKGKKPKKDGRIRLW